MVEIKIVVQGGVVQAVYADEDVTVEIIDVDEPSFATDEEKKEIVLKKSELDNIENEMYKVY